MPVPTLTVDRLREVVSYDADTGAFRWSGTKRVGVRNGDRAGNAHPNGYRRIMIDRNYYLEHRLAWFYVFGEWPRQQIDHIDRCRSNNRLGNLRDVSRSINQQNASPFRGVTWHKRCKRWRAAIKVNGKGKELGLHATKEAAHQAYINAKMQFHKGFVGS